MPTIHLAIHPPSQLSIQSFVKLFSQAFIHPAINPSRCASFSQPLSIQQIIRPNILLIILRSVSDQPRNSAILRTIDSFIYLGNPLSIKKPLYQAIGSSSHPSIHPSILRPSIPHETIHPSSHTSFINFPCVYETNTRVTNQLSISLIDPAFRLSSHLFI